MEKIKRLVLLLAVFIPALGIAKSPIPAAPDPPRLVNDFAGIFTSAQVDDLERMLVAFDDSTSNQITVVTLSDLDGHEASDIAWQIGQKWGVGNKDFRNGVVILVKPKTTFSGGAVSIQVGYGLEGAIPDIYCSRIIRDEMIPRFKENDYYGAVQKACETLMDLASGEISIERERDEGEDIAALISLIVFIVIIILIIRIARKGGGNTPGGGSGSRGRHIYIGPIDWGGSSSWGGSHGGGGFGGFGGGSFGGGGASGSW